MGQHADDAHDMMINEIAENDMKTINDFGDEGVKTGGFVPELQNKWQARETFKPKVPAPETIDDRIKYAQSWNLAVALVGASEVLEKEGDDIVKEMIERWQVYFHNKLKNK